jgi:hypothetical protein
MKEILLIQIAEEANFCGCQIAIVQSNKYQVYVRGCAGSLFQIKTFCSVKLGCKEPPLKPMMMLQKRLFIMVKKKGG